MTAADKPAPQQTYRVPTKFGFGALLGLMTALSVLFGVFRYSDAHPSLYLYFGLLTLIVAGGQMLFGSAPRLVSAAVLASLFLVGERLEKLLRRRIEALPPGKPRLEKPA